MKKLLLRYLPTNLSQYNIELFKQINKLPATLVAFRIYFYFNIHETKLPQHQRDRIVEQLEVR